jgi:membrane-associated phospholipid phosphatase
MTESAEVRRHALASGVLAVASVALTYAVIGHNALAGLDGGWRDAVIAHRTSFLTEVMVSASRFGSVPSLIVIVLVAAGLLAWRRRGADAALVLVSTAGVLLLGPVLKEIIDRERPGVADHIVLVNSLSYPSGHSLDSMGVIGLLTVLAVRAAPGPSRRVCVVAVGVLLVGIVGFSRVYLGVHWPTDVLGGWLVGMLWIALSLTAHDLVRRNSRRSGTVRSSS